MPAGVGAKVALQRTPLSWGFLNPQMAKAELVCGFTHKSSREKAKGVRCCFEGSDCSPRQNKYQYCACT